LDSATGNDKLAIRWYRPQVRMPTILTHPAVPLAIGMGLGGRVIPPHLLAAGIVTSILPDIDVVGFNFDISYAAAYGHRGLTHSPLVAAAVALCGAAVARTFGARPATTFWFLFIAMASHGVLDACTNGGLGIAFLWPWSDERFFAPFRVIQVSPIGLTRFVSGRGLDVLLSELQWVWLPCAVLGAALAAARGLTMRRR
jgi:inner membrane protein